MPVFDTPGPITATVELPVGELRVVASDRHDTTVEVRHGPDDRAQAEKVRVELVAGELRVTGAELGLLQKLTPTTPGRSIEVEIAVPTGSALSARTGYGAVSAEGRLGDCTVEAKYGDVQIEDAASATVVVGHGQARVTGRIDGDADLVSDHGGVQVGRIGGATTLRSKYGPIRADEIGGEAELTGAYGHIDVGAVQAGARVRNAHGGIRLGRVVRGEVSLAGVHGRMEVGIAGTAAAWLDLDTGGGVSNDLDPREDPSGYVDTVSVHARSRTGSIAIRRA